MAGLKNHPGMWLRDDAAAAINALEDKYGVIRINSAGRTEAQQQHLIDRWNQGGAANRPPYLYQPASPASSSNHVRDGGIAVDVYNYSSDRAKLNEFGFEWYGPSDVVHYTFRGWGGANLPAANQVTRDRQNFLNSRGWNLVVDGIEGPVTKAAYAEYQRQLNGMGLDAGAADGIWGPKTQAAHARFWASINQPGARPSSKSAGELNYADIQAALNRHGYGLAVDNVWGPRSSNALADFQAKNGLKVDRMVGPATWDKLNR